MKRLWVLAVVLLGLSLIPPKTVLIYPIPHAEAQTPSRVITEPKSPILAEARVLAAEYGNFPYWTGIPFAVGEPVPALLVPSVIAHLIPCENIARLLNPASTPWIVDSNGKKSYGILMIQMATWERWSRMSGITGDPENTPDAIRMATWAVRNGHLSEWSCAKILYIVQ